MTWNTARKKNRQRASKNQEKKMNDEQFRERHQANMRQIRKSRLDADSQYREQHKANNRTLYHSNQSYHNRKKGQIEHNLSD